MEHTHTNTQKNVLSNWLQFIAFDQMIKHCYHRNNCFSSYSSLQFCAQPCRLRERGSYETAIIWIIHTWLHLVAPSPPAWPPAHPPLNKIDETARHRIYQGRLNSAIFNSRLSDKLLVLSEIKRAGSKRGEVTHSKNWSTKNTSGNKAAELRAKRAGTREGND